MAIITLNQCHNNAANSINFGPVKVAVNVLFFRTLSHEFAF